MGRRLGLPEKKIKAYQLQGEKGGIQITAMLLTRPDRETLVRGMGKGSCRNCYRDYRKYLTQHAKKLYADQIYFHIRKIMQSKLDQGKKVQLLTHLTRESRKVVEEKDPLRIMNRMVKFHNELLFVLLEQS